MTNTPEPKTIARVREVFGSNGFRRLFATRSISQLGDGIFQLAAADLLLFDKPGANPALKLALASAVTLIPFSIVGPFIGVFIDRWDRRKILSITPAVRALLATLIALGVGKNHQGALFYLIVLLVLSANRLFIATVSAVLPQTVNESDLLVANSVASTGGSVLNVIGLGIGAALSSAIGGAHAAGIAAVAFLAGGVLALKVQAGRGVFPARSSTIKEEVSVVVQEMRDGIGQMIRRKRVRFAMTSVATNQVLVGAMTAVTIFYFIHDLALNIGSVTFLLGILAVGIGAGIVIVPVIGERMRHDALIPVSFAVAAAAVTAAGLTLSRASVTAASVVVGIAYAMTKIPVDTIVQEELPDSHRGRAFAAYDMLFNLARVAGSAATGLLLSWKLGTASVVTGTGLLYLVSAGVAAVIERGLHADDPRASETPAPPFVRKAPTPAVGEMITLKNHRGDRGGNEPAAIVIGESEIPIERIEWRAIAEPVLGDRRSIFVLRIAGLRVRVASEESSSRWEIESIHQYHP